MTDLNWLALSPEIVLFGLTCLVTLADLFVSCPRRRPTYILSMLSLAVVAALHLVALDQPASVYAMNNMVATDAMVRLFSNRSPLLLPFRALALALLARGRRLRRLSLRLMSEGSGPLVAASPE